ncbi:ABC transporter ATP-binding protein [Neomegalonema perideroedes]|uniref:ABC transporter ATP-binding protein n=1 Tax=Neomegalonema perideroedes TaxID=217219 RepID=UPI0003796F5D|nr:ABC transporter ATP-binding protein [Neomegalonema perideroedes]
MNLVSPASSSPLLRFDRASKTYGGRPALAEISLEIAAEEFVVFLGPSGCGKTTLLSLAAGLIAPSSGRVELAGAPPVPGRRSAMVFQSFRLLAWKTARENVAFALPHLPAAERRARADRYLELVGLTRAAESYPRALSGGMKQRLALARALAAEPEVLLMDEPFASLDAQARELMQQEVLRLTERRPMTVLFVTHSVDEALFLADRIILLSPRPGRVAEEIRLPFARPRWAEDPRAHPEHAALRAHLWERLREMVLKDPQSDFYGRDAT